MTARTGKHRFSKRGGEATFSGQEEKGNTVSPQKVPKQQKLKEPIVNYQKKKKRGEGLLFPRETTVQLDIINESHNIDGSTVKRKHKLACESNMVI